MPLGEPVDLAPARRPTRYPPRPGRNLRQSRVAVSHALRVAALSRIVDD
jgi:hypothetical protein